MGRFRNTAQPDRDWWRALWPDPGGVLRDLGIARCGSLVDVCCGDGYFTVPAAGLVDGPVYAIDLDSDLLADLREDAADAGVDANVTTIEGDAAALPDLLPAPVDCALLANTFHGVPEKTELARAVREALADGGRFVIVNWVDQPPEETPVLGEARGPPRELRMTPEETIAAVEPAGFEARGTESVSPHHYAVAFERR